MDQTSANCTNEARVSLEDKAKAYDAIIHFRDKASDLRLDSKYGFVSFERIPQDNDPSHLLAWANNIFNDYVNFAAQLVQLKSEKFSSKSEKTTNRVEALEEKREKEVSEKQFTKEEYYKKLDEIDKNIKELVDRHTELTNNTESCQQEITRISRILKSIKKTREELEKKGFVEEDKDSSDKEKEGKNESKNEKPASDHDLNNEDHDDYSSVRTLENEETAKKIAKEAKIKKANFDKNEAKKEKEKRSNIKDMINNDVQGDVVCPNVQEEVYNPIKGEVCKSYLIQNLTRNNNTLAKCYDETKKTFTTVLVFQKDGERFEVNGAVTPDVVFKKGTEITAYLNTNLILPSTLEEELLKKSLNNGVYSTSLMDICAIYHGKLVFSPLNFLGVPSKIYAARQAFPARGMSEGYLVSMYVDFYLFLTSKSRLHTKEQYQTDGSFSRQHIISTILGTSRVVYGLYKYMHSHIIENCKTLHLDETEFKCLEAAQKTFLWVLTTGKHEENPGIIFYAGENRSAETFLEILGDSPDEKNSNIAAENIVTDAHTAYDYGINTLIKRLGRIILHALCWVHLRREFLKGLEALGLLGVYQKAITTMGDRKFEETVTKILSDENKTCSGFARNFLFSTYCIDLILGLDADFAIADKKKLEDRRNCLSRGIFDKFYQIIDIMHQQQNEYIKERKSKSGSPKYFRTLKVPTLKAIVYALNNKNNLGHFLINGDIESHNNISEAIIRKAVWQRLVMFFLNSWKGFQAYVVGLSILLTAISLRLNPYEYFHWLFANIKFQVDQLRTAGDVSCGAKQLFTFPTPKCIDDGDGGSVKIDIFDPQFEYITDRLDWSLLTPWAYKELLDKEYARKMGESQSKDPDGSP